MFVITGFDPPSGVFAQPETFVGCFSNPIIKLRGLLPQPEFSGTDVASNALRGSADAREFVIVDNTRSIHRDVIDDAPLEEIDDVAVHSGPEDVRAHHEDAGGF